MIKFKRKKIESIPDSVKAKWLKPTLNEGFVPFPKRLLRVLPRVLVGEHAMEELAAVLAVVDYRRSNQYRPPSADFLAHLAGMETQDFLARIADLEERKLVSRKGPDENIEIGTEGLEELVELLTPDEEVEEKREEN